MLLWKTVSKQCVHSVLNPNCSASRCLIFFCFYLNSLALTFPFNSNCQVLKTPPYIIQTLLFWRTEYLVVCTVSEKWAACALVQHSEVCLLGGGRRRLQNCCFPGMTNCSFSHFEKMLVASKEMHHANKHADRLTIFSPTFTLGTAARSKRKHSGGAPREASVLSTAAVSLNLGTAPRSSCRTAMCQRCLNSLYQLKCKPHCILHQHWCIFPLSLLPDRNHSSRFSSYPTLSSTPSY